MYSTALRTAGKDVGTSSENGTRIGTKSGTIPVKEIGKDTIYLEISSKETKQILP